MLILLSPAKSLNFKDHFKAPTTSPPRFLKQSSQLVEVLREYDATQLSNLMGISDALAELNVERNRSWSAKGSDENSRPAVFAFRGDTYVGLDADTMTENDLLYAQDHLRILSGLYGVLRPLDLIQPYRLEMGSRLVNPKGKNLYAFWGQQISASLNEDLQDRPDEVLVNLASDEYFKAVDRSILQHDIVHPVFMDAKNGSYKVISFYAKKARGMMARWILEHRPDSRLDLQEFDWGGYRFSKGASDTIEPVFLRDEQE
jgi:cytoplasmic iron level regulating protein YaaA (DUF328/UPF0246 family)